MVLTLNGSALVLFLAAIVDYLIADPKDWIHPVQVMGWLISSSTNLILNHWQKKWQRLLGGMILGLGLIVGSGIWSWFVVRTACAVHPLLGLSLAIILLASCFAAKSLRLAAADVLQAVTDKNLDLARSKLSQYVGRDTERLSESEVLRAVLETVAENTTDGVTGPLFYGLLGTFFLGPEGVCLAIAYKAASTLDSMVGYPTEPYRDIGCFSARLEDYLTWLPCRLTVLSLAMFSGKPKRVLAVCWRDGRQDPSPNSGWSEAVYAATLDVQLGGVNFYKGVARYKPLLGEPLEAITPHQIDRALALTRACFLLWLTIGIILDLGLGAIPLLPDLNPQNWRP
jgi:adenosylcobinamide-phosphate synthase